VYKKSIEKASKGVKEKKGNDPKNLKEGFKYPTGVKSRLAPFWSL
jgi:hypothetical protein